MPDMQFPHIQRSDLNLLLAFQALIEERNITRAGQRIFLSQPAMSRVLDRLQTMLRDELLVRTPAGYEPTHRALEIYAGLEKLLPGIEGLLQGSEFNPAEATLEYRIAGSDYSSSLILPRLMKMLGTIAPGIQIEISSLDIDVFQQLEKNALDLAFRVNDAPRPLRTEFLFYEEFVCLFRKGHPLGNGPLSLHQYLKEKHIVISVAGGQQRLIEKTLERLGYQRNVQLKVPYYTFVASIIKESNLVATIPKGLASTLVRTSKIHHLPAPIEFPSFNYVQVWHPRYDTAPAHKWLRELVKRICSKRGGKLGEEQKTFRERAASQNPEKSPRTPPR